MRKIKDHIEKMTILMEYLLDEIRLKCFKNDACFPLMFQAKIFRRREINFIELNQNLEVLKELVEMKEHIVILNLLHEYLLHKKN